jgi:hypothetical protein
MRRTIAVDHQDRVATAVIIKAVKASEDAMVQG